MFPSKKISLTSKHKFLLFTAYQAAKQELISLKDHQSVQNSPKTEKKSLNSNEKPPKSANLSNRSTTSLSPNKQNTSMIPVQTIPKLNPTKKIQIHKKLNEKIRSSSNISNEKAFLPIQKFRYKSRSLSLIESRLSRVKDFKVAKEELEEAESRENLEKITEKIKKTAEKHRKMLESKRNSVLKNRKSIIFNEKTSNSYDLDEKQLIFGIIKRRESAEIRKKSVLEEFKEKIRNRQEKCEELKEKVGKKLREYEKIRRFKEKEVEKNIEKIENCRSKSRERLKSISNFLAMKGKSKEMKVLRNTQELKRQGVQEKRELIEKIIKINNLNENIKIRKVKQEIKVRSASNQRVSEIESFRENLNYIKTSKSIRKLENRCAKLSIIKKISTDEVEKDMEENENSVHIGKSDSTHE